MICMPCGWLSKCYSFHVAAIDSIINRSKFRIDNSPRNQPNKGKLALYKLLLSLYQTFKAVVK